MVLAVNKEGLLSAAGSHPGRARDNNEDRFLSEPDKGIFIVIDGVGGHAAGDKAADIALDIIGARLRRQTGSAAERIHEAITLANNEIFNSAQTCEEWQGMACVVTAAVVEGGQATIGHVGDTRLYKLANGQLRKITHDHSPVGEREDSGELSELEAMRHLRRNEVYRDVGTQPHEPDDQDFIELIEIPFGPDDALLMCSDGLTDMLTSAHIIRVIEQYAPDPEQIVERLIDAANEAGGRDNITVLFAAGEGFAFRARPNGGPARRAPEAPTQPLPSEVPTRALDAPADAARTKASVHPALPIRARAREALGWLDAWRRALVESRLTAFGCGLLLCLFLLLLLPDGLKKGWLVDEVAPREGGLRAAKRLFVRGGRFDAYPSIGEALAQARPGDTVEVARGDYREQISLREGVSLVSAEPQGAVIFAPEGGGYRAAVVASGITGARLAGFKITGDDARPLDVGVRVEDAEVEIERTEVTGAASAGVEVYGRRSPTLSANWIHANPGGGVVLRVEAESRVINNVFEGNGTKRAGDEKDGPDIAVLGGTPPLLAGNVFVGRGGASVTGIDAGRLGALAERNFFPSHAGSPTEDDGAQSRRIRQALRAGGTEER